jgi:hypothetical protein
MPLEMHFSITDVITVVNSDTLIVKTSPLFERITGQQELKGASLSASP